MAESFALPTEEQHNNDLFERLPFLAEALLPLCDAGDVLSVAATCQSWRRAVQLTQQSLAPKSELAMPFVAGCLHLRHLQLSHMQPAASHDPHSRSLLAHVAHLASLTQLDLACSQTRAWRGQAVEIAAEDLAYLTGCTALQVLNLSHQPCLQHPASLALLACLPCLTALHLSISDTSWVPPADAWQAIAATSGLQHLDLSGWSKCRVAVAAAVATAAAAEATGGEAAGEEGASAHSCDCKQAASGPCDWQQQQQQQPGRSRRSSDSSTSSGGSSSSAAAGSSRIGRALGRLLHGRHHAHTVGRCTCSAAAVAPVAGVLISTPAAAGTQSGCEGATNLGVTHSVEGAAPLQLLASLTRLQQLVLADWTEPPCLAGLLTLQHLPHLSSLDISRCMNQLLQAPGSSAATGTSQQVSLLSLLTGVTKQQQQQQQQQVLATAVWSAHTADSPAHARPAAAAPAGPTPPATASAPAAAVAATCCCTAAAAVPAPLFEGLLCLKCSGVDFAFEPSVWAGLSHLRCLDVSACPRFKAEGCGSHLKELQQLVASDCLQLDYDALTDLLASAQQLQTLDLQRSVIILHGSGRTAAALSSGRYSRPVLQQKYRQQAGGSSRRDVADFSGAEQASAAVPAPASGPSTAATAGPAAGAGAGQGLQVLLMSECHLAFEAFVWQEGAGNPSHPSLLLYDLVCSATKGLHNLCCLNWSRADSTLAAVVLSQLVPLASRTLTALHLSSCSLPEDPSRCWQGLAAATALRVLDLNHTGFSRQGYANPCGMNPTVALLTAVARMRLEVLWLAGWRFFFADFKPLAGLSECLVSLDLTRARGVDDRTLWSLTNLTSLTSLSVSGARVSSDQIFSLIFLHLSHLKNLDLSSVNKFTSRSLPALLQLPALTSLDIRSTPATADAAAVALLVKLPNCRRLALSVAGDTLQQQQQQWGQVLSEVYSRGTPRSSLEGVDGMRGSLEGLQAYAFLGQLRQAQSLRQLLLGGSTPSLTEYVRGLLPRWVDVR